MVGSVKQKYHLTVISVYYQRLTPLTPRERHRLTPFVSIPPQLLVVLISMFMPIKFNKRKCFFF